MIVFEKLRYKNFLSTGNSFIEFILNQHDTTLIVGANGSGKSTLLDALSFVLFGKAYRQINKPQLVNSILKKNCLVEVEFTIGEAKYMVRRGISPTVFEVYQDGRLLNQQAHSRDYQEILEEQIIKASHKSFCQIVILGTAAFEPFMKLTMLQRRDVIEDLLDLQVFTAMNLDLKDRAAECNDLLRVATAEKEALTQQLELMKRHATSLEANREETYQAKQKAIKALEEDRDEVVIMVRQLETEIGRLALSIDDEHKIAKDLYKLNEYKLSALSKRNEAKKSAGFIDDHDACPLCTRGMDRSFKQDMREHYLALEEHYVRNAEIISEELTTTQKRYDEIVKVKDQIQDLKLDLQVLKTRKTSIGEKIDDLKADVIRLSDTPEIVQDVPKVEALLEKRRKECVDLEELKKIHAYASLLLKDAGIKSKIIKQYVPIINKLINKHLGELEMFVDFTLDENFKETIKSRRCDDFSYESFSQGERQRIDLAILFAWRGIASLRNTINTNILILDETFDSSLDANAIECLINMIRIQSQTSNIIVISHKDQMHDKFEQVLEFQKFRNFSQMISR